MAVNKTRSGPAGRRSTDTGRLTWPSACQTWENLSGKPHKTCTSGCISCAAFPVRSSLSFYSTSSSRKPLVGTRVEPVVYVHSRHLQLQGDAAIPILKPLSLSLFIFFFTSFNSELKILILTCILNKSICFNMDGTHILVLKLQLITFNLFRDYKSFVSGRSPALCLPSLASSVAGWTAWRF